MESRINNNNGNGKQAMAAAASASAAPGAAAVARGARREVAGRARSGGLSVRDIVLVAVLLAAGAVLKLTVGSLFAAMGMKPNFIIAMYCLAIILVRPTIAQSAIIGLIAGLVCQIPLINATPLLNIPSELLGALACGLLVRVPLRIAGKVDLNPLFSTFFSTVISGGVFAFLSCYINVLATGGDLGVALAAYGAIVLGTAAINCVLVQIVALPLSKVVSR